MALALPQAEVGILLKEAEGGVAIKAPFLSKAAILLGLILGLQISHAVARTWAHTKDKIEVLLHTQIRPIKLLEAQL